MHFCGRKEVGKMLSDRIDDGSPVSNVRGKDGTVHLGNLPSLGEAKWEQFERLRQGREVKRNTADIDVPHAPASAVHGCQNLG